MGKYLVKLTNNPEVVNIGESANKIEIRVDNTSTKSVTAEDDKVKITVRVGIGEKVSDPTALQSVDVTYRGDCKEKKIMEVATSQAGQREWYTGQDNITLPAVICLENFMANINGNAEITIIVEDSGEKEKTIIIVKKESNYIVGFINNPAIIGERSNTININFLWLKVAEEEKVRIIIRVGFGDKQTDLLASQNDLVEATYMEESGNKQFMTAIIKSPPDKREWDTGTLQKSHKQKSFPVSICLDNFMTNVFPGNAEVTVILQDVTKKIEIPITVNKVLKEGDVTVSKPIFIVTPGLLLLGGNNAVTIRFYVVGCNMATLYRNNEQLRVWRGSDDAIAGYYQDNPSITSVYRLATYLNEEKKSDSEQIVQVMSTGWNQIRLSQGSPIRLFVAKDFAGGETNRLYGIFFNHNAKGSEDKYVLYSSPTGVDSWRKEDGSIPQHMATSPGVAYDDKLWLIGGSSVYSDQPSNQVWYYEKGKWNMARIGKEEKIFSERMGHACLVFPRKNNDKDEEEIWVMGGNNNAILFNDLWIAKKNSEGNLHWVIKREKCKWPERLKHAAVTVKNPKGKNEVWIFGGAQAPQTDKNMYDLWTTDDSGEQWKEMIRAIEPSPGRPVGCALVTYQVGILSSNLTEVNMKTDRLFLMGSFQEWATDIGADIGNSISSFIFEWQWGNEIWETNPVINGWQQFGGNNFYMQAIGFNGCLFVYSLIESDGESKTKTKLNIMIP